MPRNSNRSSKDLGREEVPPPELSPTTPPLFQEVQPLTSARSSRGSRRIEPERGQTTLDHIHVKGSPRSAMDSLPPLTSSSAPGDAGGAEAKQMQEHEAKQQHTELPDSMVEEVMARLARRAPESHLHVRTGSRHVSLETQKSGDSKSTTSPALAECIFRLDVCFQHFSHIIRLSFK